MSSRPTRIPRSLVAALIAGLALLLAVAGCGGPSTPSAPPPPPLPNGSTLMTQAATAMAGVHSTSVDLQVDPALSAVVPIRSATGKLTSTGDATGNAMVGLGGGAPAEFQFVITKGNLYLKGPTGQYQQLPLAFAANIYDPTTLLSADKGVPALLRSATGATTEAREDVNGTPTYRVRATFNPAVVGAVVPGLSGTTTGTVWLDQATSRLVRARLDVPTQQGQANSPTAPVTVTLSDYDAPVTITPPS